MAGTADKEKAGDVVNIIEDDESVRKALARLMRSMDIETTAFSTAEEFLKAEPPTAGCLIVDIQLPGIDGFDLEARLSSAGSRLPIIFITAHHESTLEERARKAGALAYFRKPFEDDELLEAVHRGFRLAG